MCTKRLNNHHKQEVTVTHTRTHDADQVSKVSHFIDDDVPTPRLGRGVEPVTGGIVSDDSHPSLRCEPTMTIQRTFTPYVSGYGESAVSTLSASERPSVDESERTNG